MVYIYCMLHLMDGNCKLNHPLYSIRWKTWAAKRRRKKERKRIVKQKERDSKEQEAALSA